MKITVIDNYDSFVYNLVRYVQEFDDQTEVVVMRNDQIHLPTIESSDAILLSPGPGIPENAGRLMEIISLFCEHKPILGVCLGHQAIGTFFGAKLIQGDEIVHGKSSMISVCAPHDELFLDLPHTLEVGRYHSWILDQKTPEGIRVTSRLSTGEIMSIRHQNLPIHGVQFHPESILTPKGRTIITNWMNSLKTKTISTHLSAQHETITR